MHPQNLTHLLILPVVCIASVCLTTACGSNNQSSVPVDRPKTNATTSDGFNPQIQSINKTDDGNSIASPDGGFGAVATTGQFILNFSVTDSGRSVTFQTSQAGGEGGTDIEAYNNRYDYILDTKCMDTECAQVMVMISESDRTSNKSYQSVFFESDSGNGYQIVKTVAGTSYDSIDDAIAAIVDGPSQP